MNLKLEEIAQLELKGTINDVRRRLRLPKSCGSSPSPNGPTSSRSGWAFVRAEADVRLAKANAYSDVYVLWQPYTFQDNTPYGLEEPVLMGPGRDRALADLQPQPGWNRAGQDQRDAIPDSSSPTWNDRPRSTSRRPFWNTRSRGVRWMSSGSMSCHRPSKCATTSSSSTPRAHSSLLDYLDAQLDYNQIVKQYLDTAVRHRRSMLSLNTVVGRRIMP